MTLTQAGAAAEDAIARYVKRCGANSPDDMRKALEVLISKAARSIEKSSCHQVAMDVLVRTVERVAENPAPTSAPVGGN
jgi:hypothetical protein